MERTAAEWAVIEAEENEREDHKAAMYDDDWYGPDLDIYDDEYTTVADHNYFAMEPDWTYEEDEVPFDIMAATPFEAMANAAGFMEY